VQVTFGRKEESPEEGRKSWRNREKKEGVRSSWNKKEILTKSKPSSLLVAPHAIFLTRLTKKRKKGIISS
jgi:hypothetical protein